MTPKQQRFVEEYLVDLNATQAATRAGYSARTANEQGARLLANASVATAIAEARKAMSERTQLTVDRVLEGLRVEATFDGEGSSHSARVSAWSWLGKHLGMFVDRLEHTHTGPLEVTITRNLIPTNRITENGNGKRRANGNARH